MDRPRVSLGGRRPTKHYWSDRFEMKESPSDTALRLLGEIDVGPDRYSGRGPQLEFHNFHGRHLANFNKYLAHNNKFRSMVGV